MDVEGIADGEVFPEALQEAIEAAAAFVYVISPDSASSAECAREAELAVGYGKRIVPIALRPVPDEDLPESIRVRNWIPFDDALKFDASVARVVAALDHDLAHAKEHTHWLLRANEWSEGGEDRARLLRGSELTAAEAWLAGASEKDPAPTDAQRRHVAASRRAS